MVLYIYEIIIPAKKYFENKQAPHRNNRQTEDGSYRTIPPSSLRAKKDTRFPNI